MQNQRHMRYKPGDNQKFELVNSAVRFAEVKRQSRWTEQIGRIHLPITK